jgi:hypothetical protein
MRDQDFWREMRRGLILISAAIEKQYPRDPFWAAFRKGINVSTVAIERRYGFPRHSSGTLSSGPPAQPPVSEPIGVGTDGV